MLCYSMLCYLMFMLYYVLLCFYVMLRYGILPMFLCYVKFVIYVIYDMVVYDLLLSDGRYFVLFKPT